MNRTHADEPGIVHKHTGCFGPPSHRPTCTGFGQQREGPQNWADEAERYDERCTAGKPLLMLIPEGGTTIECPVHPEGHFVIGPASVRC